MGQGQASNNSEITLVAIGSNARSHAGGPRETLRAALDALAGRFMGVTESRLYQTPAFPAGSGPDFVNAACVFRTDRAPYAVLEALHGIEATFGRQRSLRWGQRTLDLDLIAHGGAVLPDLAVFDHWRGLAPDAQKIQTPDRLILPHPRLQDRPFVLVPLADVAPDWTHPVLGKTVAQMLSVYSADARAEIVAIT